ncbi:hypothetical protein AA313_de0207280 [Arthrobotrys entomopaga]|nr:hypothetical protein AA313_de0207280 [Arthrobotrys entomopaga]
MADGEEDSAGLLFTDLTFHLTSHCPLRGHFKQLIEVNGGKLCKTDVGAQLVISDHLKSQGNVDKAVSYKWIEACVEKGELLDIDPYRITTLKEKSGVASKKPTKATAASIAKEVDATRPTPWVPGRRNAFTREDDCILLWWIEHGTALGGNEIYKGLAEAFPNHGFHGWRNRWVKNLSKDLKYAGGPKPPGDFDITTVKGWHSGIRRPGPLVSINHDIVEEDNVASNEDEHNEEQSNEPRPRQKRKERPVPQPEPVEPEAPKASKKKSETPPRGKFSIDEQRALFAIFDLILLGDTPDEQVEMCEPLAEQFPDRTAEEFFRYFMEEMKPAVKRLKLRGKIKAANLEEGVLKSLNKDEAGSDSSLNDSSGENGKKIPSKADVGLRKKDTRFEHLPRATPQPNADNGVTRSDKDSIERIQSSPDIRSAPPRILLKENDTQEEAGVAPVLVYTPQKHRRTRSDLDSPASFYTPGTSTSNRIAGSTPLSLRRNPPSGSGSPTPRRAAEIVDLTDENPIPSDGRANPLSQFIASIHEDLRSSQKISEHIPASSPPGLIKRGSPKASQSSPRRQVQPRLGSPISTSSTNYEESDPIPFAEPTKIAASSVKKGGRLSSSAQSAKRRRVGPEKGRFIVESTPEHKLFPPLAPLTSSAAGSSPNTMNRLFNEQPSPGQSPLARKSMRKRKGVEQRGIENILTSQDIRTVGQPSENDVLDEELVDTPRAIANESGDTTEEEADPMEVDSVTNRNLGILNDMSPTIPARRSTSPLFLEGDTTEEEEEVGVVGVEEVVEHGGEDDTVSESSEYEMSQEERVKRIKEGLDSIGFMMETLPAKYGVRRGDVAMVIDRTTADRELIEFILEKLAEHQTIHGNLDDFEWPEGRGIWTEEDDDIFAEDSPSEEVLAALTKKHGNQGVMLRWEFLTAINSEKNL